MGTKRVFISDVDGLEEREDFLLASHIRNNISSNLYNSSRLLLIYITLLLSGCVTIQGTINRPNLSPDISPLYAGSAKKDITPPPGYGMGGHSVAGKISRGQWLRLYSRSILLEKNGTPLALVSADLWSIPAGLADRIVETLNRDTESKCKIGRENLILAATHTHQSPGNYSSSFLYNAFASPKDGFDPYLFDFLVDRIAESIRESCKNKEEAQIYYSYSDSIVDKSDEPFARNRSMKAFLANGQGADDLIRKNSSHLPKGAVSVEYPYLESYFAFDPSIRVLHMRSKDNSRDIAIAAFLSVHATSLTHDAEIYNSDLFGYASLSLENGLLRKDIHSPVVAIFNGAEGDVSPAWQAQDRRDTERLGKQLALKINSLSKTVASKQPLDISSIGLSFKKFRLPGSYCRNHATDKNEINCCEKAQKNCPFTKDDKSYRVSDEPLFGVGSLGGAEDGRTAFYYCGWQEGIKANVDDGLQGEKIPAFNYHSLSPYCQTLLQFLPTRLINAALMPPEDMPIGVYNIGPLNLATLPGEFTTMLGKKITEEISAKFGEPDESNIILVGLANEYLSYFTTEKEYKEQHYEGASTVYGKWSGEVMSYALGDLAKDLKNNHPSKLDDSYNYSYPVGYEKHYGINNIENITTVSDMDKLGLDSVVIDPETGRSMLNDAASYCWKEKITDLNTLHDAGRQQNIHSIRLTPRVAILDSIGKEITSDEGVNIVTALVNHDKNDACWCTFMLDSVDRDYKFSVDRTDNRHNPLCTINMKIANDECRLKMTSSTCFQKREDPDIPH